MSKVSGGKNQLSLSFENSNNNSVRSCSQETSNKILDFNKALHEKRNEFEKNTIEKAINHARKLNW